MNCAKERKENKRSIFGIILVIVGLVLIGKKMELFPSEISHIIISWQMLLIAIGSIIVLFQKNYRTGLILIAVGSFFMLPKLFDIPYDMKNMLWPSILVVVGLLMITVRNRHGKASKKKTDENNIDILNFMSGGERKITSDNFSGGKVTTIFGGGEIDLTATKLKGDRPTIDVFTIFGGSEFIVPRDWDVQIEVTTIFGGMEDKRARKSSLERKGDNVLVIKGFTVFGGVEIKSY